MNRARVQHFQQQGAVLALSDAFSDLALPYAAGEGEVRHRVESA
ncbi:hypothetical protein BIWAKO_02450 [Bosea sp. BIWAKO-01]|nr:hypothetical protein BIWAKO_02450 [Bosea sp. BIWAKO-01]